MAEPSMLLLRADDGLLLGVGFENFAEPFAVVGGAPETGVQTAGADARLTLRFPPQSSAESTVPPVGGTPAWRLASTSDVVVAVAAGTVVEPTVTSVLAAAAAGTVVAGTGEATRLDLPYGLLTTPVARAGDATLHHPVAAGVAGDTSGLWSTRVVATAGLDLLPFDSTAADDVDAPTLSASDRARIVSEAANGIRPRLDRLALSPLGGTLTAKADWDLFRWTHDTALGRDQRVTTSVTGVLYPLGHRAVLDTVSERRFEVGADGGIVAAFTVEVTLTVVEPARHFPADGSVQARAFPFDEVALTRTVFTGLDDVAAWDDRYRRPGIATVGLQAIRDGLIAERAARQQEVDDALAGAAAAVQAALEAAQAANSAVGAAQAALDGLAEQQRQYDQEVAGIQRSIDTLQRQLDTQMVTEEDAAAIRQQIDDLQAQITLIPRPPSPQVAQQLLAQAQAEAVGPNQAYQSALAAQPHTAADLAARGDPSALRISVLDATAIPEAQAAVTASTREINRSWVPTRGSAPIRFPVTARNPAGDVTTTMPLRFVADLVVPGVPDPPPDYVAPAADPALAGTTPAPDVTTTSFSEGYSSLRDAALPGLLATRAGRRRTVDVGGAVLDLVRAARTLPGDVHEVRQLVLGAATDPLGSPAGFLPRLDAVQVTVPALRSLLPGADTVVDAVLDGAYLADGPAATALLAVADEWVPDLHDVIPAGAPELVADFAARAGDAGGIVGPRMVFDALTREVGPVNLAALPGAAGVPDLASLLQGATLLGVDLLDLLPSGPLPVPTIVQSLAEGALAGTPPTVTMAWDVPIESSGPFVSSDTVLHLLVTAGPDGVTTDCTLSAFTLQLPVATPLVELAVPSLAFHRRPGHGPTLDVGTPDVEFVGNLELLKGLADRVDLGDAGDLVDVRPDGVTAGYHLAIPDATAGAFTLRNIDLRTAVDVPFTGKPVTFELAFAHRDRRFALAIGVFGGTGYLDLVLDARGLQRFEVSLDFGATIGVNIGIAKAEVHALGGVRYQQAGNDVALAAFIRIGGSIDVLGLVTVSVELLVELRYANRTLTGRATLVIEVDLTFWGDSIELDSGEFTLAGGSAGGAAPQSLDGPPGDDRPRAGTPVPVEDLPGWQPYWEAFASWEN